MARSRNLKPGFFKNETLVDLGYEAMLCFAGLWTLADREGRLENRPRRIKAEIFPYTDADIDQLLNSLEEAGFIARYSVDESSADRAQIVQDSSTDRPDPVHDFIRISTWFRHQKPHHMEVASVIPAPISDRKSKKTKQNHVDESSTTRGQLVDKSSTDRPRSVDNSITRSLTLSSSLPLSLSSDSLSPAKIGGGELSPPLPLPSGDETAEQEQTRLEALRKQIDAQYGPAQRRDRKIKQAPAIEIPERDPPEPGAFDPEKGWREFEAAYPVKRNVDAACRWYLSEMSRTDEPEKLQAQIMAGLKLYLASSSWRNRQTGELDLQFIPGMDRFLGLPTNGDPGRGKLYLDEPAPWKPPPPDPKQKGAYARARLAELEREEAEQGETGK